MIHKITINDISRFDFNLAITFLALWEERSVSKAARRLSLSQSAVSAALLRLREAAEDPLFVRTRGGMQPTERAVVMAEPLARGVEMIHTSFRAGLAFDPATSRRRFTFGMSDDFQLAVGPAMASRFALEAPHVSVVFRQTNQHSVEAAFEAGDLDFAIVARPLTRSWLEREEIGESGYACLLDQTACDVALPLSMDDYLALPHVLVSFSGREGIVDHALRKIGQKRHVQTALTQFSALPPFLRGRRAVATLPSHAAKAVATVTDLTISRTPIDLGTYPISLLWKRTADNAWVRKIVAEAVESILTSS